MKLTDIYTDSQLTNSILGFLSDDKPCLHINGLAGSMQSVVSSVLMLKRKEMRQLVIVPNKEDAYYMVNDIEALLDDADSEIQNKKVLLFPTVHRRANATDDDDIDAVDNANMLMRAEVAKQLNAGKPLVVVTYPEALSEKVVSQHTLMQNMLQLSKGQQVDIDFLTEVMQDYEFERVDFVVSPGQYAVRGGIVDVFSYANDNPFRIELFDDIVDSLRTFDVTSQLSIRQYDQITILPNLESRNHETIVVSEKVPITSYFDHHDLIWVQGLMFVTGMMEERITKRREAGATEDDIVKNYCSTNELLHDIKQCRVIELGNSTLFADAEVMRVNAEPQPIFNKQFGLLSQNLNGYVDRGYKILIASQSESQISRLNKIFEGDEFGVKGADMFRDDSTVKPIYCSLNKGFIDHDIRLLCYTDHEIFERYHKYTVRDMSDKRAAISLKELFELKTGDFVTHIDYGIGRFSGLEKVETNGRKQEMIRLVYRNNALLYISIHDLHKISRYEGKEGVVPSLSELGTKSWQTLKQKAKSRVKDIAKDLIALYAKRKASKGFAFSPDSYLQHELEASFIYEDTPDQLKATQDVKRDMEDESPMDRLVCGDVGFGKTEVAIRAAFKAVADSKQVAVLVPNTLLAFQHYNTFSERMKGLPVSVDYLNRFRSNKNKTRIYHEVEQGKIDILIGTHAILNKNLHFKDLGLLIIDEEQKFGVAAKEKLRQMKVNVDSLTLSATPIPRTLQFSLMGARDLSIIQTPPPNRQPIETEVCNFNENVIRDAINYEMSRGGQTFFVSNRIQNLDDMSDMVRRLVPDARVAIAHGQMDGKLTEERIMQFMQGELDVLVCTSIVENGLDIPNANTMIINDAQNFGLSGLHQMRGRVGRSNRKAFCYMLVPSMKALSSDAVRRMRAIEEFSTIGSGINIAMRDLSIRGAGDILGAQQSGFMTEIGYDLYKKILDEAIDELKQSDFKDLYMRELIGRREYVRDCKVDTDFDSYIPDSYVSSGTVRMLLYTELNEMKDDESLDRYRQRLTDRFGPIPEATETLIQTFSLRHVAMGCAIVRLILKQSKMVCHFVADNDNPYYKTGGLDAIIRFAQNNPQKSRINENHGDLSLTVSDVDSIAKARTILESLTCDR